MPFPIHNFQNIDIWSLNDDTLRVFKPKSKNCICTLVMGPHNYSIFASCLIQSIWDAGMREDTDVAFICSEIDEESQKLLSFYGTVLLLPKIQFEVKQKWPRLEANYHWLPSCFTKLYCFCLTQYKKSLFLDADMLCRHNFSHIFELETPFGYLAVRDKEGLATGNLVETPDLLDALLHGYGISGAFFCVEPSIDQFRKLIADMRDKVDRACDPKVDRRPFNAGPDETLLSMQVMGWREVSREFCCVPWLAHRFEAGEFALPEGENKYDGNLKNRKVFLVHYASEKPWQSVEQARASGKKVWEDVKLFFDVEKLVQQYTDIQDINWLPPPDDSEYYSREECDEIYDGDYRRNYDNRRQKPRPQYSE